MPSPTFPRGATGTPASPGRGSAAAAEGGRNALLGLQADQAALPVPDAGGGEDRRVPPSAEGHLGGERPRLSRPSQLPVRATRVGLVPVRPLGGIKGAGLPPDAPILARPLPLRLRSVARRRSGARRALGRQRRTHLASAHPRGFPAPMSPKRIGLPMRRADELGSIPTASRRPEAADPHVAHRWR